MGVLSDDELLAKYATEFDFVYSETGNEVRAHSAGLRAVAVAVHEVKLAVPSATDPDDVLWVRGMAPVGGGAA